MFNTSILGLILLYPLIYMYFYSYYYHTLPVIDPKTPMAKKHGNPPPQKKAATAKSPTNITTVAQSTPLKYSAIPEDPAIAKTADFFPEIGTHQILPPQVILSRDAVRGRYLEAKQPLKAGISILTQQPYASAILDSWTGRACAQCNKIFTASPIQCSKCMTAHFCSRSCFNDAGPIHVMECDALKELKTLNIEGESAPLRLIIRALIIKSLQDIYNKEIADKVPLTKRNKNLIPYKPQPGYSWPDLAALMSHHDKIPSATLNQVTNIFKMIGTTCTANLKFWDGESVLQSVQLYLQLVVNQKPLCDPKEGSTQVGIGIYPSIGLINHSCSPNAHLVHELGGKTALKTSRDIKIGEEITVAYINIPLYQPSFDRRQLLRSTSYFDPVISIENRYEPEKRIVEDYAMAGVKCVHCDGQLDFHQAKHFLLPEQISVIADIVQEETTEALDGENTLTSTPEIKVWLNTTTKPANLDISTCYNCQRTIPTTTIDQYTKHLVRYIQYCRSQIFAEPHKALEHQDNLLKVVSFAKKPETPITDQDLARVIAQYSPEHIQSLNSAKLPPQIVRFVPTHHVIYNAYIALLSVAYHQFDYTNVYKYAQLASVCLNSPLWANSEKYADVLDKSAEANLFLSGTLNDVVPEVKITQKMVIPAQMKQQYNLKAYELYKKAYAIRKTLYSAQHPFTLKLNERITRLKAFIPKNMH